MRPEDIYEAIGDISDELLEESEAIANKDQMAAGAGGETAADSSKPQENKSRILMFRSRRLAAAAAAVLVLGAGAFGLSRIRMGSSAPDMMSAEYAKEESSAAAAAAEAAPAAMEEEMAAEAASEVPMEEAALATEEDTSAAPASASSTTGNPAPAAATDEEMRAEEAEAGNTDAAYDALAEADSDNTGIVLTNLLSPRNSTVLLPDDGENHVVSPVNISMALSLLAETTAGETQKQILDVLGVSSPEELREAAGTVLAESGQEGERGTNLIANSLWLRDDGTSYSPEVQRLLEESYGAETFTGEMGSAAYNDRLHKWLDDNTRGLLTDEANAVDLSPETMIALASTLYYKANWIEPFNENATADRTFHAPSGDRDVPFLATGDVGLYFRGEHFGAVSLPLSDGKQFWLMLPDEGYAVGDITADMAMLAMMRDPYGIDAEEALLTIRFPKFDVTGAADLRETLQAMGIKDVFDAGSADFTPLLGGAPAAVSQIAHAARTAVDEYGVTAAAFTVVKAEGAALEPEKEIEFVCDRPFVFAVADDAGLIYFEGVVAEP